LDYARDAYDEAFRALLTQMRGRMRKASDAGTEENENAIKWLPEELEHWATNTLGWTTKDFENSRFGQYAIIDWADSKNKARIWAIAHDLLKKEEQETMKQWKTTTG
jgi:hypothetical protein